MGEARLVDSDAGSAPAEEGWFVLNVGDAAWYTHDTFGSATRFESPEAHFALLGINVRVLQPGQPNSLYHSERNQEDFLVLSGECVLLVEGEERRLRAWDLAHFPPGTEHVVVGAGDSPCVVLMVGARSDEPGLHYPRSELALRHGAGAETATDSPGEAYARFERPRPGRPEGWDALPWSR
jgi:uncharacterized cupin superfamily protein